MRRPNEEHRARPWRVHALAPDFELLDVWRYPIEADADVPFEAFLAFAGEAQRRLVEGGGPAGMLFRLRGLLGRVFGWDDTPDAPRTEASGSLRARLPVEEREAAVAEGEASIAFDTVYRLPDEALAEIQNATVHALMHLGRVPLEGTDGAWAPEMAVYVKPRGRLGRAYMRLISPFRHGIVYPAMMRVAAREWPSYMEKRSLASDSIARR